MEEHLENVKKLEDALEKINQFIAEPYALEILNKEVKRKIRTEQENYTRKKVEEERKKPIKTMSGKVITLPKVMSKIKEDLEFEKIGDTLYGFDKRQIQKDGTLETNAYIWIPHNNKFIFVQMSLYRMVGKTYSDGMWLDANFYRNESSEYKMSGLPSPRIKRTGKYYPYFSEVINHIRKTRNIPSFKPIK